MVSILLACSLDVRTFPVRFMSLSRINSLELHFRFQLNPLAYNYIATDEKRPKLSRLFANLCLQHLLIGISGTVSDGA